MFYCRADYRYPCPDRFVHLAEGYRDHLIQRGLKPDTRRCRSNAARKFLHFVGDKVEGIERASAKVLAKAHYDPPAEEDFIDFLKAIV